MGNTGSVGKCCGLGKDKEVETNLSRGLTLQRNGDISTRVDRKKKLSSSSAGSNVSFQSRRSLRREPTDPFLKEIFDLTLEEDNFGIYDNVQEINTRQVRIQNILLLFLSKFNFFNHVFFLYFRSIPNPRKLTNGQKNTAIGNIQEPRS